MNRWTLDLESNNPQYVTPLDLELSSPVLLSVFEAQTDLQTFQTLLQAILELLQKNGQIAWVIYLDASTPLSAEQLETYLVENLQAEELDVVILEGLKDEGNEITHRAAIFQSADYYFYLPPTGTEHQFFQYALAFDKPIITWKNGVVETYLSTHIAFFLEATLPLAPQIFQILTQAPLPKGLRGYLIQKISGLDLAWQDEWEKQNFKHILESFEDIELTMVVFWGRSGASFVHSLLDAHPQVLSIGSPAFGALAEYPHLWKSLNLPEQSFDQLVLRFCAGFHQNHPRRFKSGEEYIFTDKFDFIETNFKYFCKKIQLLFSAYGKDILFEKNLRKSFFILIHFAYALALGQDVRQKKLILHQLHWPEDYEGVLSFLQDFPNLKVIGALRYPMRGFYSLLSSNLRWMQANAPQKDYVDLIYNQVYISNFKHLLLGFQHLEKLLKTPIFPLNLEKLHREPETTMQELANWLGITWHVSLLQSTQDGQATYELPTTMHGKIDRQVPTFDPQRSEYSYWQRHFSEIDNFVILGILKQACEHYKITKVPKFQHYLSYLLVFLPMRLEIMAFRQALESPNSDRLKHLMLTYLERCYYSYLYLCGYSFTSLRSNWVRSEDMLKAQKSMFGLD